MIAPLDMNLVRLLHRLARELYGNRVGDRPQLTICFDEAEPTQVVMFVGPSSAYDDAWERAVSPDADAAILTMIHALRVKLRGRVSSARDALALLEQIERETNPDSQPKEA